MPAHIGDGIKPLSSCGIQGAKVRALKTCQEVLFHVAHPVFSPAFFIALPHITWGNGKAVVGGEVQVLRIEHGRFAEDALEHGGFEVVDHDLFGNAAEELKDVLMAGQKMLQGLRDGELDIHHAAVAQHDDKEAQAATRVPHRH
jgi:hypothetical protein